MKKRILAFGNLEWDRFRRGSIRDEGFGLYQVTGDCCTHFLQAIVQQAKNWQAGRLDG